MGWENIVKEIAEEQGIDHQSFMDQYFNTYMELARTDPHSFVSDYLTYFAMADEATMRDEILAFVEDSIDIGD